MFSIFFLSRAPAQVLPRPPGPCSAPHRLPPPRRHRLPRLPTRRAHPVAAAAAALLLSCRLPRARPSSVTPSWAGQTSNLARELDPAPSPPPEPSGPSRGPRPFSELPPCLSRALTRAGQRVPTLTVMVPPSRRASGTQAAEAIVSPESWQQAALLIGQGGERVSEFKQPPPVPRADRGSEGWRWGSGVLSPESIFNPRGQIRDFPGQGRGTPDPGGGTTA